MNRMLDGKVEDPEEQAILVILRESKIRSVAEFLQLSVGAGWERLDGAIDGEEHAQLVGLYLTHPLISWSQPLG
jgi:hypothetical protein